MTEEEIRSLKKQLRTTRKERDTLAEALEEIEKNLNNATRVLKNLGNK